MMAEITWENLLGEEKQKPYFKELLARVEQARTVGKTVYPSNSEIFNALKLTPLSKVKVVILGQDPYHGPGQAHGLCFSVKQGTPPPPSLENIFKELKSDLGILRPSHGCLEKWAEQGVLLLNSVLTVEANTPGSHSTWGWQTFTDHIIQSLSEHSPYLVFILWGAYAQKKEALIDKTKHTAICAPHPSPLSAHRGFLGSKPFSKCNNLLQARGLKPIDWSL
jgi:uracil-DNA glycosylase